MTDFNDVQRDSANGQGKASYVWMGVSAVLLVLLIVVAVANPFAKKSDSSSSESVATVNGVDITKAELYDEMYANGGSNMLENLIVKELLSQEAANKNISINEQDVDAEIDRQAVTNDMTADELKQMFLMYYGLSEEAFRGEMEQQVKIRRLLADQIDVTDEEIQQYYDENVDSFTTPEQVRASHILVETEEEAQEILDELKQGADFATLAQERSTDTGSAVSGGDLNFFPRGKMVAPFEEAAFSMEIGEVTLEPVRTDHGYHIIKKTDHQQEKVQPLDEVRDEILYKLEDQELTSLLQGWFAELREKADIKYPDVV